MAIPVIVPEPFASLGNNVQNLSMLIEQLGPDTGGIIPFVGAGMSVDFGFPQWSDFLKKLAPDEAVSQKIAERLEQGEYEEAAEDLLGLLGANSLQDAIDFTFGPDRLRESTERALGAAIRELPQLLP